MTIKMPRGAIPTPRHKLASSEPYRPAAGAEIFLPSGMLPTPNHELAGASPYQAAGPAPASFLAWPAGIDLWRDEQPSDSNWAEEAFAKACAEPKVIIPPPLVLLAARACGVSNFSEFLQTHGFQMAGTAYLDGPFYSVDWTDPAVLHTAIAHAGPVKIGISSAALAAGRQGQVTPGKSGWAVHGLSAGQREDHWASLCGYGPLPALADLFARHETPVCLPHEMPTDLCYAMFIWNSLGIIDRRSLAAVTGEAWVRNPTTIVKQLGGTF
jgi:hypothetical protein